MSERETAGERRRVADRCAECGYPADDTSMETCSECGMDLCSKCAVTHTCLTVHQSPGERPAQAEAEPLSAERLFIATGVISGYLTTLRTTENVVEQARALLALQAKARGEAAEPDSGGKA